MRRTLHAAANAIGLQIRVLNVSVPEEFDAVFAIVVRERIGAVLVHNAPVFTNGREKLVQLAESYAVPTCYEYREFVRAGGLMSYGASNTDIWRQVLHRSHSEG
jgi:putative ABC transport system substrate-binding protein